MRWLVRLLCVCALGAVPLVGCMDFEIFDDPCDGVVCDDDNECTEDRCSGGFLGVGAGCRYEPVDDGTACTLDGLDGVCVDGVCDLCAGIVCEGDGNECTRDCNPATGTCDYIPVEDGTNCDDGDDNECAYDTCIDGVCVGDGAWIDNGTACDFDGLAGVCVDGVCEEDPCEDLVCDDDNECTDDTCDYVDGTCNFTPVVCDDDNRCTHDTCEPVDGCLFTPLEDGTICPGNSLPQLWCIAGQCVFTCDPRAESVYACPVAGFEDWLCCPPNGSCSSQYNCGRQYCLSAIEEVYPCPVGGLEHLFCCPGGDGFCLTDCP